jgi:[acyl-carrier-protein] S-malonyltransferase
MEYFYSKGISLAVEFGPKSVLKNLMKGIKDNIHVYSFDNKADLSSLRERLSKSKTENNTKELRENKKISLISKCVAIAVCTKNRNWDEDEYQRGVVEPYRKIKKLHNELVESGKEPDIDQMRAALDMLGSVFRTKKTPLEERVERFNEVFEISGTREHFKDFIVNR